MKPELQTHEHAGRRVLVAGAGGIGCAIARAFNAAGARVAIVDVHDQQVHDAAQSLGLLESGGTALCFDLTNADSCRDAVNESSELLGGLDIVVHAVGVNSRKAILDVEEKEWRDLLDVNLASAFFLGQAAGRLMCAQDYGRIVFVSSVSGLLAHALHGPYAASKGGMNQLMRVMAREWAPHHVTVNAIGPGYTETELTRDYLELDGMRASLEQMVPAGRLGTPEDLVAPVLFLASEGARFVTGQVLLVDGGRTLV